jgi:hypothetical protein
MALATVQTIVKAGTTPAYATPLASENIIAAEGQFLHVKNANASACVVTMVDPGLTPSGSVATNPTVSVPATTGDKLIPLDSHMQNSSTGLQVVTFSVQTSVTAALIRR